MFKNRFSLFILPLFIGVIFLSFFVIELFAQSYSRGVQYDPSTLNLAPFAYRFQSAPVPATSDGYALGSTSLMWSDLFLASGAVINFNNGNYTLTHSSGLLTGSGAFSIGTGNAFTAGTVELGAASDTTLGRGAAGRLQIEGVNAPTISSTDTFSNKTIDAGSNELTSMPVEIGIACSDESTAITTGTAKATFRVPFAFTLTAIRASVSTAPTGSTIIIDVNENGTTLMDTGTTGVRVTIDAGEETTETAAAGEVLTDTSIAADSEITIDFDQIGSSTAGAGVKVWLVGTRTI